ncbi:MAG: glucose-1-phosphate thymidylyltransferase [Candidatus Scalindua rubra]|uniref:Glucose-1-phosphate thymidylyltransferase n=1 Tax=Candidatus Scalindua rubra TaxID=1872076 RepID=A0A1E3X643_9BACT|nr:MAG: glucose-1-phosphate thymidylyltransferase [Candidatus Scalindua rubra]
MKSICIFEDSAYQNFLPLVYNRPVYELRCGIYTLLERIILQYPDTETNLFCRKYLEKLTNENNPYNVNKTNYGSKGSLFLNGRFLMSSPISISGKEEIGIKDDAIVYARLLRKNCLSITPEKFLDQDFINKLKKKFKTKKVNAKLLKYPWDIITNNKEQITFDFTSYIKYGLIQGKIYEGVHLINASQIFTGKNTVIKPGCVLDAENGPVYIGNNVKISSNSVIIGPAFIGDNVVINDLSRILAGSNIGRVCKIGGEIVNTIIQDYTNKQHDGFLGDSYIGSWVNLGADTINSNLTNTYGTVKVQMLDKIIDTGQMFHGMIMGDHTKTAINTRFTTGSIIGFACNILLTRIPPKFIPSFSWYSDNVTRVYDIKRELQVAKRMMARRNKKMSRNEEKVFKTIFTLTERERRLHDMQ